MKSPDSTGHISNFGKDDPEALARIVDMTVFDAGSGKIVEAAQSPDTEPGRLRNVLLGGTGLVAAAVWLLHPQGSSEPVKGDIMSYTELAQESAQIPASSTDTVLLKNIKLNVNDSDKNSGSEAILNNKRVQQFMDDNPDERAAIISSANALPAAGKYAIVERDINGDGEGDAIAVAEAEIK